MHNVRKTVICLSSALFLSIGLLQTAMADEATFSGTAQGMDGPVTVNLTMDGEKITGVTIDATETPGIGDAAIEPLIEQIMEAQSADIAGVSGATVTSTAVKDAIAKALEEAAAGGATIADRFKLDAPVQKQAPKGTTAVFICALIALGVVGVLAYMLWKHWEFLMPA